ncbi:MAG: VIT domain-containing protein [Nannocystaceae bacterium]
MADPQDTHPTPRPMAPTNRPSFRRWLGAGVLLAILAGATTLAITQPWRKPPPVATERLGASLELAAGEVLLASADGAARPLLSKTPLPVGAELRTGAGARALARLGDGTRVFLRDQSRVRLDQGVTLLEGQLWIEAPPLEEGQDAAIHRVGDHTVALSDGGASLRIDGGDAEIYVAEGLAIVTSAGGRAEVKAGERAQIKGGGAPEVGPVAFWDDWTGGMGDRGGGGRLSGVGTGSLYAVDRSAPPGAPALPLTIQRQTVRIVVQDDLAETMVDQRFFNPSGQDVEGWYWFTVPEDALLVSFALETDGVLIEGEVVERKQAAQTYEAAVQRARDPALLEWIDAHTVRARIFPVPALGERRIVLRYQQLLTESEGKIRYRYPLAGPVGRDASTIEEFALSVDLRGELARTYDLATLGEARVSPDGRSVTMRRSGYTPRADFEMELSRKPGQTRAPLRLSVRDPGGDQARFVMVRYAPDLDFTAVPSPRGDVVVVVDTSAAGDTSEQQTKIAVAEALLRSLSAGDRFAVMCADVSARVLYPDEGLADAAPEAIAAALERVSAHQSGGATDLGAIFERALERVHGLEQPAVVYIGDGRATSGERSGDALAEHLRRSMTGSRARLFTIGVGASVDAAILGRLARVGGGESLRVEAPEQAVMRALELSGALKTPTITDLSLGLGEGLDDVFVNQTGKLSRGQELVLLARTHHDLPETVTIRGRLGGESFEREVKLERHRDLLDDLVPRLWAATFIERLLGDSRGPEAVRGKILSLGLEYGLMTPYTSFLALENEWAYAQQGIQRRQRPFGAHRLTADASHLLSRTGSKATEMDARTAFLVALSAPFGCGRSAPDDAEAQSVDARAEAAPPAPPMSTAPGSSMAPTPSPSTTPVASVEATDDAPASGNELDQNAPRKESPPAEPVAPTPEPELEDHGYRPTGASELANDGDGLQDKDLVALGGATRPPPKTPEVAAARRGGKFRDRESNTLPRGPVFKPPPRVVSPVARGRALPCSDAAARPLADRRLLWIRRLAGQPTMVGALESYEAAAGSCELPGWKDQRVFLQLLQERVATEDDARLLLAHFDGEADARDTLARALLRRLVDPGLIAAVESALFGGAVDWRDLDRRLLLVVDDEPRKLAMIQQALAQSPGDPQGELRLVRLLAAQGKLADAIARGRRLREQGLMTPGLAQQLGEVFVAHGEDDQARRVFSEIVEFDPQSPQSRRLLGDIFLRYGWYEDAYRQYEDLMTMVVDDAPSVIRLARAAAGAGRVDEALRILRKVAGGEGRPGIDDPRRWARLHAAAHLARLLESGGPEAPAQSVARELTRLQLFEAPTSWTLVLWEDLEARLILASETPGTSSPAGDALDAGETGLYALQGAAADLSALRVRHRGPLVGRPVVFERITITWDGKTFEVDKARGEIAADEASAP